MSEAAVKSLGAPAPGGGGTEVYALIRNIVIGEHVTGIRIFVNRPDVTPSVPNTDPHYVTTVAFLSHEGGHAGAGAHGGAHQKKLPSTIVNLTDTLRRLYGFRRLKAGTLTLQLIPVPAAGVALQTVGKVVPGSVEIVVLLAAPAQVRRPVMPGPVNSIRLIAFGTLVLCLLACAQEKKKTAPTSPKSETKSATDKPDMTVRPDHVVRWSKVCDPETLDALADGRLRVGITVKAFKPPTPGPRAFVVHLVPSKNAKRQEVDRFEITPNVAFRVADGAKPQRFFIDLRDHVASVKDSKLNLEVEFDSRAGKLKDGMAEITFDLVRLK